MDIIILLEADHLKVEQLFNAYEDGDESVGEEIVKELELHTKIEEAILYPKVRSYDAEEADHAKEEHDEVDSMIAEFKNDYSNSTLLSQIKSAVMHHVQEEETEMFPSVRAHCSEEELQEMGRQAEEMKNQ